MRQGARHEARTDADGRLVLKLDLPLPEGSLGTLELRVPAHGSDVPFGASLDLPRVDREGLDLGEHGMHAWDIAPSTGPFEDAHLRGGRPTGLTQPQLATESS